MKTFASRRSRRARPLHRAPATGMGGTEPLRVVKDGGNSPDFGASVISEVRPIPQQRGNTAGGGVRPLQTVPRRRCTRVRRILRTRKVANAPPAYYGAKFNHKFSSGQRRCTLRGMEVSEDVKTTRDDFRTGTPNIPVGQVKWTLNAKHELNIPDHIYSQAGPNGLGVNPVKRFPAVLAQSQKWHYRLSQRSPWRPGPTVRISATLSGRRSRRRILKIRTRDNGVSRTEPYRGPRIRIRP
jgi:hypothetical protein